jgi:protein-S-isoprenylcysteine O-methyltransferase Ste14
MLAGAAPIAELLGLIASFVALQAASLQGTGLVLALCGMAVTVISQYQMGDSLRVGVDTRETTALMTAGLFTVVRNPIFTGTLIATAGLVMMVPNLISATAAVCLFLGLEMQVRWIEEPYLARAHGERYRSYARVVGRFLPRVGRTS